MKIISGNWESRMLGVGVVAELRGKSIVSRSWSELRSGCVVNEGLSVGNAHLSAPSILIDAEFKRPVLIGTRSDNCINVQVQDKSLNLSFLDCKAAFPIVTVRNLERMATPSLLVLTLYWNGLGLLFCYLLSMKSIWKDAYMSFNRLFWASLKIHFECEARKDYSCLDSGFCRRWKTNTSQLGISIWLKNYISRVPKRIQMTISLRFCRIIVPWGWSFRSLGKHFSFAWPKPSFSFAYCWQIIVVAYIRANRLTAFEPFLLGEAPKGLSSGFVDGRLGDLFSSLIGIWHSLGHLQLSLLLSFPAK